VYVSDHIQRFPSVTTICDVLNKGEGLIYWACKLGWKEAQHVKNKSAKLGQEFHEIARKLLVGEVLSDGPDPINVGRASSLSAWLRKNKATVLKLPNGAPAIETTVYSYRHGYAGTFDAILRVGRKNVLVDWKTSNSLHEEYKLQTAAYKYAIQETYPKINIDERRILRFDVDGSIQPAIHKDDGEDFAGFLCALGLYNWTKR
jgi:hypothetical protein